MSSLSTQALEVIQNYLHLPFPGHNISCPYFNNRRARLRGGLRALIGKGSPADIVEEATIISLREKINLNKITDEELKKFLIDKKIGIDCSGLVYHILDAEMKAQGKGSLQKILKRPWFKNPIRKLLVKLRPIENTGVGTFNHEINSMEINLKDLAPGDLIIIMGAGVKQDYNHILLINQIADNKIQYTHSFQYPNDGLYNHGVRQETITITDPNKSLLDQTWSEPQMQDYAKKAKECKIARLRT
ncbi:MAG: hypothetical protein US42_C0001G0056 [Candidatus Magasanikbacteria bacterium GW2011_GWC2_37_14]|uniref:Uncharacterized protein n=1 Tax=Candidatus Magasanikbacteria bacterium GW2011_GWC2_37_14 TaxID=1619046 RepID=A0A0G0GPW3_9BACT|nr:MAG: hypothetical protein US42_C0001G0056 [Candidatus Magasanikbacteria bacterium GW2011_GWC2_37_14]